MRDPRAERTAIELMTRFAERTGLATGGGPVRRYLWTDAFAVCNFVGLARATGRAEYRELASRLVEQVHDVLGRHRADDARSGMLSGLEGKQAGAHPTLGGLRIGKDLPERGPGEPFDEGLEWDRDGQYFHYLTKWMHALDQLARHTANRDGNRWARELAHAAHAAFTYAPSPGAPKRMYWKMSIDLARPLVPSMGHHDPLDALVTYQMLRARRGEDAVGPDLDAEAADVARICEGKNWVTDDPLGLGGLLADADRVEQLVRGFKYDGVPLLASVLGAAAAGLRAHVRRADYERSASGRLAFRELGLSIGLHAVQRMWTSVQDDPGPLEGDPRIRSRLEELTDHLGLRDSIESFWLEPDHRQGDAWRDHQDINDVMLATSLAPTGYLELA